MEETKAEIEVSSRQDGAIDVNIDEDLKKGRLTPIQTLESASRGPNFHCTRNRCMFIFIAIACLSMVSILIAVPFLVLLGT